MNDRVRQKRGRPRKVCLDRLPRRHETEPHVEERLRRAYTALFEAFGPQHWWPGDGPFEVMVGAVLTQNAAWKNAERALARVRAAGAMSPEALAVLPLDEIETLVRPAGGWRRKAATLASLARWVAEQDGGLDGALTRESGELRRALLEIRGVGPETADSILLYAARRPVFVIDAYTRRFTSRHALAPADASYDHIQALFEQTLDRDPDRLGECHALLVELGKRFCRPAPLCGDCPLSYDLPELPRRA